MLISDLYLCLLLPLNMLCFWNVFSGSPCKVCWIWCGGGWMGEHQQGSSRAVPPIGCFWMPEGQGRRSCALFPGKFLIDPQTLFHIPFISAVSIASFIIIIKKNALSHQSRLAACMLMQTMPQIKEMLFQERRDEARYFDAHVLEVKRRLHDIRGCRCLFLIRYDHDFVKVIANFHVCKHPPWNFVCLLVLSGRLRDISLLRQTIWFIINTHLYIWHLFASIHSVCPIRTDCRHALASSLGFLFLVI